MSALTPRGSTRRWRRIRLLVLERDLYRCRFVDELGAECGAYATHVHHIDARAHGADDNPDKLAAACAQHNLSKGREPGLEIRQPRRAERRPEWSW